VIAWTIDCKDGFAVSMRCVRTSLSKSRPFSDGTLASWWSAGVSKALETNDNEIAEQVGVDGLGTTTPGHGQKVHLPEVEMRQEIMRLAKSMRSEAD
jgi:hypothetical protein